MNTTVTPVKYEIDWQDGTEMNGPAMWASVHIHSLKANAVITIGQDDLSGFSVLISDAEAVDDYNAPPDAEIHDSTPGSWEVLQARATAALFSWVADVLAGDGECKGTDCTHEDHDEPGWTDPATE